MSNELLFETRSNFRAWLNENCQTHEGIWITFGKSGGPKTLSAEEALEEALCYGWIDGQIKSFDDKCYLKYFSQRSKTTEWSEKNIRTVERLEANGKMTDYGRAKIEEAKQNNRFKPKERIQYNDTLLDEFLRILRDYEPAYTNFLAMSPSVKRTYILNYFDAKSDTARENRLSKIIDRLNQNLKPM